MIVQDYQSPSVYVQQTHNFIQTGQGFAQIKKYLYKQLQDDNKKDQNLNLLQQICQRINIGLLRQSSQIADRCVYLMQELLQQNSQLMSEACNNQSLVFSLITLAMFKRVITLHPQKWDNIKSRICGIFLFWWQKFSHQQSSYHYLIFGYRELRHKNIQFPLQTNIRQKTKKKPKSQKEKQQQTNKIKAMGQILQQISMIVQKAQMKLKNNPNQLMNKQSVRMLKYKNKYLYDLSTSQQKFSKQEKQKIGKLYKRIRNVLKVIQDKNQKIVKNNQAVDQQKYIKQKLQGISPKKNHHQKIQVKQSNLLQQVVITKQQLQSTPKKQNKKSSQNLLNSDHAIQIKNNSNNQQNGFSTPKKIQSPIKLKKAPTKQQVITKQQSNLLDIESPKKVQIKSPNKNQQNKIKDIFQIDLLNKNNQTKNNKLKQQNQNNVYQNSPAKSLENISKQELTQLQQVGFDYNYQNDLASNSSSSPQRKSLKRGNVKERQQKTPNYSSGSKKDLIQQIDDLMSPISLKQKQKENKQSNQEQQFGQFQKEQRLKIQQQQLI